MKHIGELLKGHIEKNHLVKREIADKAGITYNYLSTIFKKDSIDICLFEKLCMASGLNPIEAFETSNSISKNYSDITAHTTIGDASVLIEQQNAAMQQLSDEKDRIIEEKDRLIAEKERTIKILLAASNLKIGTEPGQDQ